jgi:hypothetical protein
LLKRKASCEGYHGPAMPTTHFGDPVADFPFAKFYTGFACRDTVSSPEHAALPWLLRDFFGVALKIFHVSIFKQRRATSDISTRKYSERAIFLLI